MNLPPSVISLKLSPIGLNTVATKAIIYHDIIKMSDVG
jgi:hypothetical protein